jgi:predicted hydrocarbon binding protein
MPRPGGRAPELAIPVASLAALRHALTKEVGPDAAARALSAAGHAAGDALFSQMGANEESERAFWRKLTHLFNSRGWGTLVHSAAHEGVGALDAGDWVEADEEALTSRPSCFFTTGMLANLLGNAAGAPVTVLEVECRSRGDARCRFLFGSNEALNAVYEQVGSGVNADEALAELSR